MFIDSAITITRLCVSPPRAPWVCLARFPAVRVVVVAKLVNCDPP